MNIFVHFIVQQKSTLFRKFFGHFLLLFILFSTMKHFLFGNCENCEISFEHFITHAINFQVYGYKIRDINSISDTTLDSALYLLG